MNGFWSAAWRFSNRQGGGKIDLLVIEEIADYMDRLVKLVLQKLAKIVIGRDHRVGHWAESWTRAT
jgi:hypothetical protein